MRSHAIFLENYLDGNAYKLSNWSVVNVTLIQVNRTAPTVPQRSA
jgi:hypothetical protein